MFTALKETLLALPFHLLPHHAVSRLMFVAARIEWPPLKNAIIAAYIRLNPVNMDEARETDPFAYRHLNAFFTRALKADARPFAGDDDTWLCPVDGAVSQAQAIEDGHLFQAKGHRYTLTRLLGGDRALCRPFENGHFATLYLSPRDYHRIHMPAGGRLKKMLYLPGRLFSVAGFTVNRIAGLFARNERCICYFETEDGPMILVLVGAINVSAIQVAWHDGIVTSESGLPRVFHYEDRDITLQRGEEMGRFNLGSTVIVLMPPSIEPEQTLRAGRTVRLGEALARKTQTAGPDGHNR